MMKFELTLASSGILKKCQK